MSRASWDLSARHPDKVLHVIYFVGIQPRLILARAKWKWSRGLNRDETLSNIPPDFAPTSLRLKQTEPRLTPTNVDFDRDFIPTCPIDDDLIPTDQDSAQLISD